MNFLKQAFGVAFAVFLIAAGVNLMFAPHNIAAGGVGGISIILKHLFGFNMSIVVLLINAVLLVVGYFILGKQFFIKTFYGTLLFPVFLAIIPTVALSHDVLLSVLFGSLITAIAVNILYYLNASSGGTSIPPLILKKLFGTNTSFGLFISDAVIVLLSLFVFGIEQFMYAILVIMLTSIIMESLTMSLTRKKVVYIISDNIDDISRNIMKVVRRGATKLLAEGAYSGNQRQVLMVVLNDRDLHRVQTIIDENDPKAFVFVQNISKVLGEGFSYYSVMQ
jgi:uncharacterized membrane-anchored protein YitT (DUF2179 family)